MAPTFTLMPAKPSILTAERRAEQMAAIDRGIAEYAAALEANDKAEDAVAPPALGEEMGQKLAVLGGRRPKPIWRGSRAAAMASFRAPTPTLGCSPSTGRSWPDTICRLRVDAKHKLIVASDVVNDGNDTGQLHAMAQAAKEALGVDQLTAVADRGYDNGETLKACEAAAITAYVPPPTAAGD